MARAMRCPCCDSYMFVVNEYHDARLSCINYACRNHACRRCHGKCRHWEKVFTEKAWVGRRLK